MLPRFVEVPGSEGAQRFIRLEELIANHLDDLFPGMEILDHHAFRLTRNEDVEIEEDEIGEPHPGARGASCCAAGSVRRSGSRSPTTWTT